MDYAPPTDSIKEVLLEPCTYKQASSKKLNFNEELSLKRASEAFPGTKFKKAWLSCVEGLIGLQMENGNPAYTDKNYRFLLLGIILDSFNGSFIDQPLTETSD